jgi:hypothetical protein
MKPLTLTLLALMLLLGPAFQPMALQAQKTTYRKLPPTDDNRVRELATKLLAAEKADWGEPLKVERVSQRTVWVRYKTPKRDEQRFYYRIVAVDTDRWKAEIVRNE